MIDMLDWVLSKFGFEGFEKKLFGIFGLDKDFSLADSIIFDWNKFDVDQFRRGIILGVDKCSFLC